MVFKANGAASFPESLRIQTLEVSLSLTVTSATLWFFKSRKKLMKNFQNFFKSDREKRLRIFWKREGENIFREGEFARRMKRRLGFFGDEIFLSMKFVVIVVRAYLSHWITMTSYDNEA